MVQGDILAAVGCANLDAEVLRFFDLTLDGFAQAFPDILWVFCEGDDPVDVEVAFGEVGACAEDVVDTGAQFEVVDALLTGELDGLVDEVASAGFIYGEEGAVVGEGE